MNRINHDPRPGLILVIGGSRSGKSRLAEELATRYGGDSVTYIATIPARDDDPEFMARIARHRADRNPGWITLDAPDDLASALTTCATSAVLLDCLTGYVSMQLLSREESAYEQAVADTVAQITEITAAACRNDATIIIVSNEVGMGVVPANALARRFRDAAGIANQNVATAADEVWLVTAGIPQRIR